MQAELMPKSFVLLLEMCYVNNISYEIHVRRIKSLCLL